MVGSPAALASGRNYAKLVGADSAASRFDAVMNSQGRDDGRGVPYQAQYALRTDHADKFLWIEDNGRWFAGADGKPSARTASSASSTSGTPRRSGWPISRASTG